MTAYLLEFPSQDSAPARVLFNHVSKVALAASSSADAKAMAKGLFDGDTDALWVQATATDILAAVDTDLAGWTVNVRVIEPTSLDVIADVTVEANGSGGVKATGTLTLTPGTIADDVVKVDTTYYKFAADPTTGTPDGSVGNPYLVAVGANNTAAFANLVKAINASGVGGTDYAAEITVAHATVEALTSNATTMSVRAKTAGAAGNSISTTVTATGGADGLAWGATTLTGGISADSVDSLSNALVTALNATDDISNASYNASTNVLTVAAGGSDALGDHIVDVHMRNGNLPDPVDVTALISSVTDEGMSSADLKITFQSDSYTIPTVVALLKTI